MIIMRKICKIRSSNIKLTKINSYQLKVVVESWESHVTQKPRGTERVVLLDTFRCIVRLYIKVLLEFLWIMRPRLLIIAPAIRLQVVESLN